MVESESIKREIYLTEGALERAAAGVVVAWKAADAGQIVEPTDRLYFEDWNALCTVVTPKRYELLRHLRRIPADTIRELARALGRDVKRVHKDVTVLEELGLVEKDQSGRLSMPLDEISATIRFAA
jgi:predicted transcriptional regulator